MLASGTDSDHASGRLWWQAEDHTATAHLESLKAALSYDRPPFCSGAVTPPPEGFHLYYGKGSPRFIDFASSTPEQLDQLAAACDQATFGRGGQDVHDESYRKALKMDAADFSAQFDPTASGLIKTIEESLLQGQTSESMSIRPEIYKLNIYGKDSFFKAHKDTPRGAHMVGSLVIIHPTPHQGGELVLRHKEWEWPFDAKTLISSSQRWRMPDPKALTPPSLAYVAFYSDLEHEVLKVTSGPRITLTYNLYLVPHGPIPETLASHNSSATSVKPNLEDTTNFGATLGQLLRDPRFMPTGGTLAFDLAHLYPVTFNTKLGEMIPCLKGEDAHVYQSCRRLELHPVLRMIYNERQTWAAPRPSYGIMMKVLVNSPFYE